MKDSYYKDYDVFMRSKWYEYKERAVQQRKKGASIVAIEARFGIPRSTLSGWFQDIHLNRKQEERLLRNKYDALERARGKAVQWHREQKRQRMESARRQALETLIKIDERNPAVIELALALLYLGEGSKRTIETAMGNSDPMILHFFLSVLRDQYSLDIRAVRCELSLRADQHPERMKRYWATTLKLPMSCFKRVHLDQRTVGSPTYPHSVVSGK